VKPPKARNEAESQLTDPRKNLKRSSLNCGGYIPPAKRELADVDVLDQRLQM